MLLVLLSIVFSIWNSDWDLPKLTTLLIGDYAFHNTTSLTLSSKVGNIWSIDLPQLAVLTVGKKSFYRTKSLYLESLG